MLAVLFVTVATVVFVVLVPGLVLRPGWNVLRPGWNVLDPGWNLVARNLPRAARLRRSRFCTPTARGGHNVLRAFARLPIRGRRGTRAEVHLVKLIVIQHRRQGGGSALHRPIGLRVGPASVVQADHPAIRR